MTGDPGAGPEACIYDRTANTTTRVSLTPAGEPSDGSVSGTWLSADGRSVAFTSSATNLLSGDTNGVSDVFVRRLH